MRCRGARGLRGSRQKGPGLGLLGAADSEGHPLLRRVQLVTARRMVKGYRPALKEEGRGPLGGPHSFKGEGRERSRKESGPVGSPV